MLSTDLPPSNALQTAQAALPHGPQVGLTVLVIQAIISNEVGIDCSEDELLEEMYGAVATYLGEGPHIRSRARALLDAMGCAAICLEDIEKRPMQAARRAKENQPLIQVINEILMQQQPATDVYTKSVPAAAPCLAVHAVSPPPPLATAMVPSHGGAPAAAPAPMDQLSHQMAWLMQPPVHAPATVQHGLVFTHAVDVKSQAEILLASGDNTGAEEVLRRALAAKPQHAEYRRLLGKALINLQRYDEAKLELAEAVKIDPANASYHAALSEAYLACWDDHGLTHAHTAVTLAPDVAHYHALWADCLRGLRRENTCEVAKNAEGLLRQLLRDDPTNVEHLEDLGVVLRGQKYLGAARAILHATIAEAPKRASAYTNLAACYLDEEKWHEAVAYARQAHTLDPLCLHANAMLGLCLTCSGAHEEAEMYLRVAHELSPASACPAHNLGRCLSDLGRWSEAEQMLRAAAESLADMCSYHWAVGRSLYELKKYDEAEVQLREAHRIDPEDEDTRAFLAFSLSAQGKYAEAEPLLRMMHVMYPEDRNYASEFATALRDQNKLVEAESVQRKALRLSPDSVHYANMLGNILFDQDKYAEAVRFYLQAHQLSPSEAVYANNAGDALFEISRWEEAEKYYRAAYLLKPTEAGYADDLAKALLAQGKRVEAMEYHREAHALAPNEPMYANALGNTLGEDSKWDEAEKYHRMACELDPQDAEYANNVGLDLFQQQKYTEAVLWHGKALELAPDNALYASCIGNIHMKENHLEEAEKYYRLAHRFDPQESFYLNDLGNALFGQGKYVEAAENYRKATQLGPDHDTIADNFQAALARIPQTA